MRWNDLASSDVAVAVSFHKASSALSASSYCFSGVHAVLQSHLFYEAFRRFNPSMAHEVSSAVLVFVPPLAISFQAITTRRSRWST